MTEQSRVGRAPRGRMSDDAVREATGKDWSEWFAILDAAGARAMPHADIAGWLSAEQGVPGWWTQGVTVAYEQEIGRRLPGQRADGTFTTTATKRVGGDQRAAFDAAVAAAGAELGADPGRTNTETTFWSATWKQPDGTAVGVRVNAEPDGRALVAFEWRKIGAVELVEAAKDRLRAILDRITL